MNAVLMIAYNNLELTKQAVASVLDQDIPVDLYFVDNGSTDGTWEWIETQPLYTAYRRSENASPTQIANDMASQMFLRSEHVLGVPNDIILPRNCYSSMLKWPRGFICASLVEEGEPQRFECTEVSAVSENTPMGVMMTRKWAYDAIVGQSGYFFDPGYFHYASDCDLALRMAACGIRGVQLNLPVWHYRSATLRLSDARTKRQMEIQADKDREYFERKWGFKVDSLEYGQRPADINFRGNHG